MLMSKKTQKIFSKILGTFMSIFIYRLWLRGALFAGEPLSGFIDPTAYKSVHYFYATIILSVTFIIFIILFWVGYPRKWWDKDF